MNTSVLFERRRAGVLLHPTSLPGPWGNGDLGEEAFRFIDFLAASGQTVWQILPLGPTHRHCSPYQCLSALAGNPLLINIDELVEKGWVTLEEARQLFVKYGDDFVQARYQVLERAHQGFRQNATLDEQQGLKEFIKNEQRWLHDYALYHALRKESKGKDWSHWPVELRDRQADALDAARQRLHEFINQVYFEQYIFFRQWNAIKDYANNKGILVYGDMPIFVAYDSADVWASRQYFELDDNGFPLVVAGVPPDYFSESGQRWGNPHYRWSLMESDGFQWWQNRIAMQLRLFDLVRIDHFRGFESYWEIPVKSETAINGRWVKAPGDKLFRALQERFKPLPLIAEDLGIITPEVTALREKYDLPGMKILQFAFDGSHLNPYLPHNHEYNFIVYTGTHDNNTTLGWYKGVPDECRHYVNDYMGPTSEEMPWSLIRSAYASVASMAIIPMQDILSLDGEHRMNTPGTIDGNWQWRYCEDQLTDQVRARMRHLTELYGRG